MTIGLEWAVFAVGLAAGAVNSVGIVASVLGYSDYYPLGEHGWHYYLFWGLSHALNASLIGLGYLQWRDLPLPSWTLPAGLVLFVVGYAVAIAAGYDLGIEETKGMRGDLRTDGWYRYSRNPQYVGYVAATVGYALFTAAPLVAPLCGIYLAWWFLFPLAEEPWLREEFGKAYERYAARTPRFVGVDTVRALVGAGR